MSKRTNKADSERPFRDIPAVKRAQIAQNSPKSDPDVELFNRFLSGDNDAYVRLYAKYETRLLLYCKRVLMSDALGEDAFQELWIRIFELRHKQPEVREFQSFLFRAARNLCCNVRELEQHRSGSDLLMEVESGEHSHLRAEQKELKQLLRKALAKLPFDQREAFVLHEYSGYSYPEIAEIMGEPVSNVRMRAFRARHRLRKVIGSWLGLEEDADISEVI